MPVARPFLNRNHGQKAFTLTELAIVLGIMGVLLGALWGAASSVSKNQQIAHANQAVLQIEQAMHSLYSTSTSTGTVGDITSTVISANVIPPDLINPTNAAKAIGPWPNSTLKVLTLGGSDFTIQLNGIPTYACVALLGAVGGTARDPSLSSAASATASTPVTAGVVDTALAVTGAPIAAIITAAKASAACTAAAGSSTTFVQFGFNLH